MKHVVDDGVLQTNLLQAFQKNKIIQGKLNERQHSYHVQLAKDMQEYNLKQKLNKELLYSWKKEAYVRQLKKDLQEYERKRFGARDAYYEYQAKNLDAIIAGQQGLVIPPREEERRLNVKAKFNQFIEEHPIPITSSVRIVQSANATSDQSELQQEEEEHARAVEETWKPIHAQSAVGIRRKKPKNLPSIQRASTMDEIKRNQTIIPPVIPIVITIPEVVNATSEEKQPTKVTPGRSTLSECIEPIIITTEALKRQTRADLIAMRSVRRPQKNPIDLNIIFESRKRIYQINKRVYDYQLCHRKCGLQYNSQFDRPQQIDPADDEDNLLVEMDDTTRKRYEDRHQSDKNFL
jgi:hypothetical protein